MRRLLELLGVVAIGACLSFAAYQVREEMRRRQRLDEVMDRLERIEKRVDDVRWGCP